MIRVLVIVTVAVLALSGCASQGDDAPQWQKDYLDCVMDLGSETDMPPEVLAEACEAVVSQ